MNHNYSDYIKFNLFICKVVNNLHHYSIKRIEILHLCDNQVLRF